MTDVDDYIKDVRALRNIALGMFTPSVIGAVIAWYTSHYGIWALTFCMSIFWGAVLLTTLVMLSSADRIKSDE